MPWNMPKLPRPRAFALRAAASRPSQLWRVATALLMDMQQAEVLPNLITKLDLIGVARCRGVSLAVE